MGAGGPRFDRKFSEGPERFSCIGSGEVGGKAAGLLRARAVLREGLLPGEFPGFDVDIPSLAVLCTGAFDAFIERNGLGEMADCDLPDERIAGAFQRAELPVEVVGDLRSIVESFRTPLAVRSSGLLEDALASPFAGVYETKMVPNNQPDLDTRFLRLAEAVKFVYASTFFRAAKTYRRAAGIKEGQEKMAVIVQEVVGLRHGDRFYPDLSGVARSYSFYRSGYARAEDGVVNLALGLGKTIVDGGIVWSYSPAYPRTAPPCASASARLKESQNVFWAVNMGKPPAYDPIAETEYLLRAGLPEAESDGTLRWTASTYDPACDLLRPGIGTKGPRLLDFAPLLDVEEKPLNALLKRLLEICEGGLGEKVEIEFAAAFREDRVRFGFLQLRPMAVSHGFVEVREEEMAAPGVLLASDNVLGNGREGSIRDVVYVKPESFQARDTRTIAGQVARMNERLLDAGRPYLLIGFGRWGSSDPWLGIPVGWGQICGAKAVAEVALPSMSVDPSQGSHFFHNISSFSVSYFCLRHGGPFAVDWDWLSSLGAEEEAGLVRHVRLPGPLEVRVDGRTGRGVIRRGSREEGP
jgi:hypothetical protein